MYGKAWKPGAVGAVRRRMRGASAVEFALVVPLLIMIFIAIIDFSFMLYDKAMITNAAREGARAGIVLRNPRLNKAQIESVATSYCANTLIRLTGSGTCTAAADVPGSVEFGKDLKVTVNYQYGGPILSWIPGFGGIMDLASTAVMKYE